MYSVNGLPCMSYRTQPPPPPPPTAAHPPTHTHILCVIPIIDFFSVVPPPL